MLISGNPGSCSRGCYLQEECILLLPTIGGLLIWDHVNRLLGYWLNALVHCAVSPCCWHRHWPRVTPSLCYLILTALVSASRFLFYLGALGGFHYLQGEHSHIVWPASHRFYLFGECVGDGMGQPSADLTSRKLEVEALLPSPYLPLPAPTTHTYTCLESICFPYWSQSDRFKTQISLFFLLPCLKTFAAFKIPVISIFLYFSLVPCEIKWSHERGTWYNHNT